MVLHSNRNEPCKINNEFYITLDYNNGLRVCLCLAYKNKRIQIVQDNNEVTIIKKAKITYLYTKIVRVINRILATSNLCTLKT